MKERRGLSRELKRAGSILFLLCFILAGSLFFTKDVDAATFSDTQKEYINVLSKIRRAGTVSGHLDVYRTVSQGKSGKKCMEAALIENGIVYENGCDDTSLGRKPRQLSYKGDLYYVISVELMPKKVRAGIADLYGEVQQWTEKEIIVENGVDEVLGQLDSAIDELLEKRKKDVDVIAIAVGVPALTGQNDLNDLFGTSIYGKRILKTGNR